MALVLAVSLLPTYAFAASVPTSTTIDGNTTDFTGAWKSAHDKPGTYTVTANLAMPGQYNPILTGVTIRKVPGKTGIDLDNTTIEVIKLNLEPYGYTLDMNYAIAVKTNGDVCQNWLAGENVMTLTVKLGDYQKLGWSGDWPPRGRTPMRRSWTRTSPCRPSCTITGEEMKQKLSGFL